VSTPVLTEAIPVQADGVRFVVGASDPSLVAIVSALLPPGAERVVVPEGVDPARAVSPAERAPAEDDANRFLLTAQDGDVYRVVQGDTPILTCSDLDLAAEVFKALVQEHVAINAVDRIFVTAAAVAAGGRAIVLLGPALGGNSTLARELVGAGAAPLSDRYAVLDEQGFAHRYASDPADQTDAVPVALIVSSQYRPGAVWAPQRGTQGEGALALMAHAVAARERPEAALRAAKAAAAGAVYLEGDRGEANDAVRFLLAEAVGR
jgi:hypothetical protein